MQLRLFWDNNLRIFTLRMTITWHFGQCVNTLTQHTITLNIPVLIACGYKHQYTRSHYAQVHQHMHKHFVTRIAARACVVSHSPHHLLVLSTPNARIPQIT